MGKGLSFLAGAAVGAAATYFLDPQGGARRRHETRDKAVSAVKSTASEAATATRHAAHVAQGAAASATPSKPTEVTGSDVALARKVESEIFRAADAPKGAVSVNAENGVVFLRGEVAQPWIERLGADAERVEGVVAVRNLLHLPGTEAPVAPGTR